MLTIPGTTRITYLSDKKIIVLFTILALQIYNYVSQELMLQTKFILKFSSIKSDVFETIRTRLLCIDLLKLSHK